jgi:hypothetical protein
MLEHWEYLAAAVELGIISYIGWRAFRSIRRARSELRQGAGDALAAIRTAACETIRFRWASDAAAQEMAMFYYAFFSWRRPVPSADAGFSSYRKNSYGIFLAAIVMVLVIEMVAVHIVVYMFWSGLAAAIFTAISTYSLIWMIADWQAMRLRLTSVSEDTIHLKLGSRWEAEIPLSSVVSIGTPEKRPDDDKPLKLVPVGLPNLQLRLSKPVTARGMYGLRRTTSNILLQLDEPENFSAQLEAPAIPD